MRLALVAVGAAAFADLGLRVVPVELVFKRFPRMVRDLAQAQGKQIRLELTGQEVKIDKAMVESLADPLLHMVRNSADHGVEKPEERRQAGKPDEAVIRIQAEQQDHRDQQQERAQFGDMFEAKVAAEQPIVRLHRVRSLLQRGRGRPRRKIDA